MMLKKRQNSAVDDKQKENDSKERQEVAQMSQEGQLTSLQNGETQLVMGRAPRRANISKLFFENQTKVVKV